MLQDFEQMCVSYILSSLYLFLSDSIVLGKGIKQCSSWEEGDDLGHHTFLNATTSVQLPKRAQPSKKFLRRH